MTAATNQQPWNELHTQRRHNLNYPAEPVVRFLVSAREAAGAINMLDLGCGAGRHMKLAQDLLLDPVGVDFSEEACRQARRYGPVHVADMAALPFEDDAFDTVVCFGVIYYGTQQQTRDTVLEIRRVLKPGGYACITLRTKGDWRFEHGTWIDDAVNTIRFEYEGEPEDGMLMNWADADEVNWIIHQFDITHVSAELVERRILNKRRTESDYLLVVRK